MVRQILFAVISTLLTIILTGCGGGSSEPKEPKVITPTYHNVTSSVSSGGKIQPTNHTAVSGYAVSFTLTADVNYKISSATGCDGTLIDNIYTTGAITAACEISVAFESLPTSNDGYAPTAKVIFPNKISRADGSTITLSGVAHDSDGVKEVRVNGEVATLLQNPTAGAASKQAKSEITGPLSVNWQTTFSSSKDTQVIVETEDISGNVDQYADSVTILNERMPTYFTIDTINNRLLGQHRLGDFVLIDLATDESANFQYKGNDSPGKFVYHNSEDRMIYADLHDNQLRLHSFDLVSEIEQQLVEQTLEFEPSRWGGSYLLDMDIDQANNDIYLLLIVSPIGPHKNKRVILKYDMTTSTLTAIADENTAAGQTITTDALAYSPQGLLLFHTSENQQGESLSLLTFDGSEITQFTPPLNLKSEKINVDLKNNIAYTSGYDGFSKIELVTGKVEKFSLSKNADGLSLSTIRSTGLDLANNRLLVSDSVYDVVMEVDLTTGVRQKFYSNGVGIGPLMAGPRAMVLDNEHNRAYVADDGGNFNPVFIMRIDLATGNRTKLITLDELHNVSGLAFDKAANKLYLLSSNFIIKFDLDNLSTSVVFDSYDGAIYKPDVRKISDIALDKVNNRLLAVKNDGELLSLPLDDQQMTLISSSVEGNIVGAGPEMLGSSVVVDESGQIAYVASQRHAKVFKVDLNTGNRQLVLDSCKTTDGREMMIPDSDFLSMSIVPGEQRLLISGRTILSYNTVDDSCLASTVASPLDMESNDKGQLFVTDFNRLSQVEVTTGSTVRVSK